MGNRDIWDKVCEPPKEALKQITGGRLRGMTDINPQWRIKALTETFGPCGIGWVYTIDRLWTEPGADGVVMCFALVSITYCADGVCQPVVGIGGSQLIEGEKSGLHSSDEGYKMAVTDALSVACKMLGIASAIYEGRWDGSKYRHEPAPAVDLSPVVARILAVCREFRTDEQFAALKADIIKDHGIRLPSGLHNLPEELTEAFRKAWDEYKSRAKNKKETKE